MRKQLFQKKGRLYVMPYFTTKELQYIVDILDYEDLLIKQYLSINAQTQSTSIQGFIKENITKHQEHYEKLLNMLNSGTQPEVPIGSESHVSETENFQEMNINDIQQAISQPTMGSEQSYGQSHMNEFNLQDEDLILLLSAHLSKAASDYTMAITCSSSSVVRKQFELLLRDTLSIHSQLQTEMQKRNVTNADSQEIQQKLNQKREKQVTTNQLVQKSIFL